MKWYKFLFQLTQNDKQDLLWQNLSCFMIYAPTQTIPIFFWWSVDKEKGDKFSLFLTHYWSTETPKLHLKQFRQVFDGKRGLESSQYLKLIFANVPFFSSLSTSSWQCCSCDWAVWHHANQKWLHARFGTMSHIDKAADTFSTPHSCWGTSSGKRKLTVQARRTRTLARKRQRHTGPREHARTHARTLVSTKTKEQMRHQRRQWVGGLGVNM